MESQEFKEILKRFSENKLTEAEQLNLEKWYASYDAEEFTGFQDEAHASRIKAEMFVAIGPIQEQKGLRLPNWRKTLPYAAAAVLLIAVGLLFKPMGIGEQIVDLPVYMVYRTNATESKKITLADNSIIHLNPSSEFKIARDFGRQGSRTVFLEKGNAFFEVAKDPEHPFLVHSGLLTTTVLGTKFKVSHYTDQKGDLAIEVSLVEGKVAVATPQKVLTQLVPGKKINYNLRTNTWKQDDFGLADNNQWYVTSIDLNQGSFEEVARIVKLYYGVSLTIEDPNVGRYQYNIQMRSTHTLSETLKIICSIHHKKYRRTGNGIIIY
ncbi:FecR family protein [Pedobacter gandavensis]|uniref:FecR family protein n=1 Tax=Pedobacter gandavensis TaxID=2679963 RepID=UPI002930EB1C|nr:FecR family protein [Pedobacter gandavensis]